VRDLADRGLAAACHDVSDGGLLVALAEMALAAGLGISLSAPPDPATAHGYWFGEDQGRYLVATASPDAVLAAAGAAGVRARRIGQVEAEARLTLPGEVPISLEALRSAHEAWLPRYMAGSA
jgi:phosphoribosylformylglycinamidine synthase